MDEAADGVAREVAESQGDTSELFEAPVDGFGGVRVVEVGGSLNQALVDTPSGLDRSVALISEQRLDARPQRFVISYRTTA